MSLSNNTTVELQILLDRAIEGDRCAYDELICRALERLHLLTQRLFKHYPRLRRWEETDDVFQRAVLRLRQSLTEVRPGSVREFFGLAATQTRRILIDLARHYYGKEGEAANHHSNPAATRRDPEQTDLLGHQPADHIEPETLEAWNQFHKSIELLPHEEREVVELIWYSGLDQQRIAEIVGVSLATVKRRWREARKRLFEHLNGADLLV